MADGKRSFVLYCDLIHTIDLLDDLSAGKLFKHLLKYVNDLDPETDDLLLKIAFEPIKRQLKRDLIDWEDTRQKRVNSGHLGGIKSAESRKKKQNQANEASASNLKQTQANEAVTVTVSVNDTVTGINSPKVQDSSNPSDYDSVESEKEKITDDKKVIKKIVEVVTNPDLKKKKKVAPKKKTKNPDSEPYWHDLRKKWVWFNLTHLKFKVEPIPSRDYSHMHRIIEKLRERAVGQAVLWTQENALMRWEKFLNVAFTKDDWLKNNFLLSNLEKQMQTIFNLIDNPNGQAKQKSTKSTAGSVGKTIEFDRP